ncbi:hypothetical protein BD311DRAFT_354958 [Dichomitus squalens]|uniref:Uncharacterized protein n=1 Tax=Dichomitus squalens TaxID=114155 RepID=A0A4Q9MM01_9APHY|nr:hypothetical protein BD311DRAFT_354958 [Dichomitus squalens]
MLHASGLVRLNGGIRNNPSWPTGVHKSFWVFWPAWCRANQAWRRVSATLARHVAHSIVLITAITISFPLRFAIGPPTVATHWLGIDSLTYRPIRQRRATWEPSNEQPIPSASATVNTLILNHEARGTSLLPMSLGPMTTNIP